MSHRMAHRAIGPTLKDAVHTVRAIAAVNMCLTCGLPKVAVAVNWRGRGRGDASVHFDAQEFASVCKCLPCGGCGERTPRDEMVQRMVERAPGAELEPLRLCHECAGAVDAMEVN